ncbi:MAG: hypothetical protein CL573_03025 [Alphaproteobacteria bacterium]|nr:hypothetical protein [Alphaproteobacteria bacterium]HCP00010.1 DUF2244 domain-containing protein [Rhodospirillaceae bacterium]
MDKATVETAFDAALHPHRSLSPRRGKWVLLGIASMLALVGLVFSVQGAWPILPFFGCEILLFWWAFRANTRDGCRSEHLRLTPDAMIIVQVEPSGLSHEHRFAPPHWVSVKLTPYPSGNNELRLASHGRSLRIGAFLSPQERCDLADALREALRRLRRPS